MSFFWKIDFRQKNHLEVVLSTSNAKKWIFWAILRIFCHEKLFHTTFSFFCRSPTFGLSYKIAEPKYYDLISKYHERQSFTPKVTFSRAEKLRGIQYQKGFLALRTWKNPKNKKITVINKINADVLVNHLKF